jgi:hypothetical protein
VLLIAREDAAFGEKRHVAPTVWLPVGAVKVRRDIDDDFGVPLGDKFEPFGIPIVPDGEAFWVVLVNVIGAKFLFEPGVTVTRGVTQWGCSF